jgi:hypothetical protein
LGKKQHRKAHAFTEHLANVFQPQSSENEPAEEEALTRRLELLPLLIDLC